MASKGSSLFWKFIKGENNGAPIAVPVDSQQSPIFTDQDRNAGSQESSIPPTIQSSGGGLAPRQAVLGVPELGVQDAADSSDDTVEFGQQSAPENQGSQTVGIVNIVDDFYWTLTPKESLARQDCPRIFFYEYYLKTNALANQVAYNLIVAKEKGETIAETPVVQDLTQVPWYKVWYRDNVTKFQKDLTRGAESIEKVLGNEPEKFSFTPFGTDTLKPYDGLYFTKPSKFNYIFPYFNDAYRDTSNTFQTEGSEDQRANFANIPIFKTAETRLVKNLPSLIRSFNITAPGTYIERPKFFNFPTDGESVTFNFPLLNTKSIDETIRNYQLLFLLTYQNRPNRRTKDLIDPPVVYEVHIPGTRFEPYAYIEKMSVNFMGARREMDIPLPVVDDGDPIRVTTIIPDAYNVEITVKGLVGQSRNLLYSLIDYTNLIVTR